MSAGSLKRHSALDLVVPKRVGSSTLLAYSVSIPLKNVTMPSGFLWMYLMPSPDLFPDLMSRGVNDLTKRYPLGRRTLRISAATAGMSESSMCSSTCTAVT